MGRHMLMVRGKLVSWSCLNGKHGIRCTRLECCCTCHNSEPVEDRTVTPELVLDRGEPRLDPPDDFMGVA